MSVVALKSACCDKCLRTSQWLQPTAAEARKVAAGDGWKRHKGKDYCGLCEVPE